MCHFILANHGLFCIVMCVLMTQATGESLIENKGFDELFHKVRSFCLTPAKISCPNDCDKTDSCSKLDVLAKKTMAFLFTKENPSDPEYLHQCGGKLPTNTKFDNRRRTEIFIHGWLDGVCRSEWMREMKNELFKRGSYNVILIDWTHGNGPEYYTGGRNTYITARFITSMVKNIMEQTRVSPNNFHLVGHSFGAQIVGFVGKNVPGIKRITALDPALDPFLREPASRRLTQLDARFVDVIHSNGGRVPGETIGDSKALGDADFYPNGGVMQPSCESAAAGSFFKLDVLYGAISLSPNMCSHVQSIQFYKASINDCGFVGHRCENYMNFNSGQCPSCAKDRRNCPTMRMSYPYKKHFPVQKGNFRKYYLNTTLTYPYCR